MVCGKSSMLTPAANGVPGYSKVLRAPIEGTPWFYSHDGHAYLSSQTGQKSSIAMSSPQWPVSHTRLSGPLAQVVTAAQLNARLRAPPLSSCDTDTIALSQGGGRKVCSLAAYDAC